MGSMKSFYIRWSEKIFYLKYVNTWVLLVYSETRLNPTDEPLLSDPPLFISTPHYAFLTSFTLGHFNLVQSLKKANIILRHHSDQPSLLS